MTVAPERTTLLRSWYESGLQLRYACPLIPGRRRHRDIHYYCLVAVWSGELEYTSYKYDFRVGADQAAILPGGWASAYEFSPDADRVDPPAVELGFVVPAGIAAGDALAMLPLPVVVAQDDPARWRETAAGILEHQWVHGLELDERLHLRPALDDLVTRYLLATDHGDVAARPIPEWLQAAHALMQRGYLRPDFDLAELARTVGISPSRLQHAFKDVYGVTPGALLRRLRLQLASRMLRSNPEYTIAEVAQRSGHASPTAFGAAFKRAYGVSPLRFRQGDGALKRAPRL